MMERRVLTTPLSKRQQISSYVIVCLMSLLEGIEQVVVFPTLYLRLKKSLDAPEYVFGIFVSVFSLSGLVAAPIMGRVYDRTHNAKILLGLASLSQLIGCTVYFFSSSAPWLVAGGLVAGFGNGYLPIVWAEISYGEVNTKQTSIFSAIFAFKDLGAILGPAFSLFLYKADFYIGPFIVDKYSSPGIFVALLWLIILVLIPFFYHPFTSLERVITPSPPPSHAATQNGEVNLSREAHKQLGYRSVRQVVLDSCYEEYMAIFMILFAAIFNQHAAQTLAVPLCDVYLGWTEMDISITYSVMGGLMLLGYVMVYFASKKVLDRTQIMFGSLCQLTSLMLLTVGLPLLQLNSPEEHSKNMAILIPSFVINTLGLPFLFVCLTSLFSKLLTGNIQGLANGIRRGVGGVAAILGPLWAGSLLQNKYLMLGVMLGLNCLALLLLVISYKRLVGPPTEPREIIDSEVNERSRLLNSS